MSDTIKLEGFQECANFCGIEEAVCAKLPIEWPINKQMVGKALKEAGYTGDMTAIMKTIEEWRDAASTNVNPGPAAANTAAAAPGAGMNITVRTGNPEDMTVQELLTLVANGERSTDITQVLRRKVGTNRRVYVREAGTDKLDIAETMELINQEFEAGQEPPFWGSVPTETLNEILQMRQYADPLTGVQLAKGDPWLKLGEDDKVAAFAYAKMKGVLTGTEDKYTLVNEATAGGERWNRILALWNRGVKSSDPQIMEARAAITYKTSRGTNRKESEYRNRGRADVSVQGGHQTGDGFRDNQ